MSGPKKRNWTLPALAASLSFASFGAGALADDSRGVLTIGVLNDQSGLYADITGQGSVAAAKLAVEDFGGAVLGKKIEVIFGDAQNKPDIASAIARKWIEQDHVDVIADGAPSSVGLAIQEVTRDTHHIFLGSGPATSVLTGKACSPTSAQWTFHTYSLAKGPVSGLVSQGLKKWFIISVDYAFGQAMKSDVQRFLAEDGATVVGTVSHPLNTSDFASYLLQAKSSGASVVALANAGGDTVNAMKQASEFGIAQGGQSIAGLLVTENDVGAMGVDIAQGLVVTTSFYWDRDEATRAWTKRFQALRPGKLPNMVQAGVYGSVLHYLKAVKAAGSVDADAVMAKMRALPIDDFYTKDAYLREDGRVMRDMYLARVKKPENSKYPGDFYNIIATVKAKDAFRPLSEGGCPYIKTKK